MTQPMRMRQSEPLWALARLSPEQERLLREGEKMLGGSVLLAYDKGEVSTALLSESQLEYLQGLEQKLGISIVAVKAK